MKEKLEELESLKIHVRDFLWAVDRGYFGPNAQMELNNSAYVKPLREAVADDE